MAKTTSRGVAVFDLDRTLLKGGTFTPFLLMTAREEPDKFLFVFAVLFQMILYVLKIKTRTRLKEYMLHAFVEGMSKSRIAKFSKQFLGKLEAGEKFQPAGLKAIAAHKKQGHVIVIATAAMDFYAADIAEFLGADHLISSVSVWHKGGLVALLKGGNCYGPEKANRVKAWLEKTKPARVWFYSDSHTDLPTFALADEKIAVNPTAKLGRAARANRFEIQIWK